jgi:hypothetical protein
VYYPLFLLPLWISFYWKRGVRKFVAGTASMLALLMLALWFDDSSTLADHLQHMYGVLSPLREAETLQGLWALGWNPFWRLPVIVGYVILSAFFCNLAGTKKSRNHPEWICSLDDCSSVLAW